MFTPEMVSPELGEFVLVANHSLESTEAEATGTRRPASVARRPTLDIQQTPQDRRQSRRAKHIARPCPMIKETFATDSVQNTCRPRRARR
ncbi:hypothetical protein DID97_09155 [Burkholderia sp. Bp8977]|nr:hypothetical protein DIE10_07535 [Burkholderia sp. Bp9011]RQR96106.1 hypothetical protein DIE09_07710 [Burkholderia sp. Bp9010]RQS78871.1 hypothetical protein DID97_09155 [Burkholderia sp. Bp8977]